MRDYKITYIGIFKADVVEQGVLRYWINMSADRGRLYAMETLDRLVTHLKELKELPEFACETITIERQENYRIKLHGYAEFEEAELEQLAQVLPLV